MQNINTTRQNILENVNVGMIIESFNPVSMQGTALKKILVESNNDAKLQSITGLTEIIFECNKARHIDSAAFKLGEDISEHLSNNIKAKLVYCYESIQNAKSNALLESLKTKLDSLVILEDSQIVNIIRSGGLNAYRSVKPVTFIIESVSIKSEDNALTAMHEAYNPVSYTEINEAGTVFLRLNNQVFAINEAMVVQTNSPSPKFSFLSGIVEALQYDYENNNFSVHHDIFGQFTISESKITRCQKGSDVINEHMTSKSFIDEMSMIVESFDNQQKTKSFVNEHRQFIDALVAIHENYDNLTIADNVVVVECKTSKDKFAIISTNDKAYVSTLKSTRLPNILESFNTITEALSVLKHKSGYSADNFFTKKLIALTEATDEKLKHIDAQKLIVEQLEAKRIEISGLINEEKHQNVPNIAKQEKLKEAFQLNEAYLVEQTTILHSIL